MSFSKMEGRKVKQVLSGGWYKWEEEDIRKRVYYGEYSGNTYSCMKMEK
jgi:hypothetical protein